MSNFKKAFRLNPYFLYHVNLHIHVMRQLTDKHDECIVCYDQKQLTDYFYCGHYICSDCFSKLKYPRCVYCRKVYDPKWFIIISSLVTYYSFQYVE